MAKQFEAHKSSNSGKSSSTGRASQSGLSLRSGALGGALAVAIMAICAGGWAVAQDTGQGAGPSTDKISKFLMIKLSRDQSQVLCKSEVFTSCMGFTEQACLDLSEKALEQCIVPLPDTVSLQDLNSEVLEVCPQEVYAEAGFSNDKAVACLEEASKN